MKYYLSLFLMSFFIASLFIGCSKEDDYSVRVQNGLSETMKNVSFGSASFKDVEMGITTDYVSINVGEHILKYTAITGSRNSTPMEIKAGDSRKWTILIVNPNLVRLSED